MISHSLSAFNGLPRMCLYCCSCRCCRLACCPAPITGTAAGAAEPVLWAPPATTARPSRRRAIRGAGESGETGYRGGDPVSGDPLSGHMGSQGVPHPGAAVVARRPCVRPPRLAAGGGVSQPLPLPLPLLSPPQAAAASAAGRAPRRRPLAGPAGGLPSAPPTPAGSPWEAPALRRPRGSGGGACCDCASSRCCWGGQIAVGMASGCLAAARSSRPPSSLDTRSTTSSPELPCGADPPPAPVPLRPLLPRRTCAAPRAAVPVAAAAAAAAAGKPAPPLPMICCKRGSSSSGWSRYALSSGRCSARSLARRCNTAGASAPAPLSGPLPQLPKLAAGCGARLCLGARCCLGRAGFWAAAGGAASPLWLPPPWSPSPPPASPASCSARPRSALLRFFGVRCLQPEPTATEGPFNPAIPPVTCGPRPLPTQHA